MSKLFDIGEFVKYSFVRNEDGSFRVTMDGPQRFADLFLSKIGGLRFSEEELIEHVEDYEPQN